MSGRVGTVAYWVRQSFLCQVLIFSVPLLYWFGFGGTFEGSLSWRHQLAGHLACFAGSLGAGLYLCRSSAVPLLTPPLPVSLGIGLLLADKALRVLVQQSWQAPEELVGSLSAAILFYVLLYLTMDGRALAVALVVCASVCCVAGIVWSYQGGYPELALPLGNRPLMAGFLILAAGPVLGLLATLKGHSLARMLTLGACLLLLIGVLKTRSATAVAALAAACSLGVAYGIFRRRRALLVASVGAVVLLWTAWSVGGFEPLDRLESILKGRDDPSLSWNNRLRFWSGAVPAMKARPLLGYGSGEVGRLYALFRLQQPGLAPHGEVVPDLHSTPLNWVFEFGLLGAALRLIVFGWFVLLAWLRGNTLQRWAATGLAVYGFFSLFHYQLSNPAIVCTVVCIAAVASPRETFLLSTARKSALLGGLLVCLAAASLGVRVPTDYANYLFERSGREPVAKAARSLLQAAMVDPRGGFYDFVAALRIERSEWPQNLKRADLDFLSASADRHFLTALERNPNMPLMLAAHGRFQLHTSRPCQAVRTLQKAVSLDFYFSLSHFDLANAYRACGQLKLAVDEAAVAVLTQPSAAFASAWREESPFLRDSLQTAVGWLSLWTDPASPEDTAKLHELLNFLSLRLHKVGNLEPIAAQLTMSDTVATDLTDDPFAFILERRSPYLVATQFTLDAPATGSWSPPGIGSIRSLRVLQYKNVIEAYDGARIADLVKSAWGAPLE